MAFDPGACERAPRGDRLRRPLRPFHCGLDQTATDASMTKGVRDVGVGQDQAAGFSAVDELCGGAVLYQDEPVLLDIVEHGCLGVTHRSAFLSWGTDDSIVDGATIPDGGGPVWLAQGADCRGRVDLSAIDAVCRPRVIGAEAEPTIPRASDHRVVRRLAGRLPRAAGRWQGAGYGRVFGVTPMSRVVQPWLESGPVASTR